MTRSETLLNDGWMFSEGFEHGWTKTPMPGRPVCVPHNALDLPLIYLDEAAFQRPFTYQRLIHVPDTPGRAASLRFDGAMADSHVWVNGTLTTRHPDGYTPFQVPLNTGANLVTLRIDGSENPAIPPFGGQIDYLTYAGLYRDVWLCDRPERQIRSVKVETPDPLADQKTVRLLVDADGPVTALIRDPSGQEIARAAGSDEIILTGLAGVRLWSSDDPALYAAEITLDDGGDLVTTRFGFRLAEWTPQGFFLNGQPMKLRGLNRHQSYPYSGYAMGRAAQERDADMLRHEFGCNIVRTSHYPQSPWFLDRCDEIGLLVFDEIPGWQHIGDASWQDAAVENTAAMIRRDWNHPSIVIWGVRINESADHSAFYRRTNAMARELDSTRAISGVRCITDSELLEDVYAMNDFVLDESELPGINRPRTALRPPAEVTGLAQAVPYIVTEYNGHMFPTKAGDGEMRQMEHVIRHLDVLNAAHGDPGIAGCIGWCMFDYNTHKDFGSGDRICHHGVMDIWRNPKFAAFAYASQKPLKDGVVMEPVTFWARGERNFGGFFPLIVLTNCDQVELSVNGLVRRAEPDRDRWPHLPHPPVVFDRRHFTAEDLGLWGMAWHPGCVTGLIDGKAVALRDYVADPLPTTLELRPDMSLMPAHPDDLRVTIRGLDQAGNRLPFLNAAVTLSVDGPAELIGPPLRVLQGGQSGCWLRLTGAAGIVALTAMAAEFPMASVQVHIG